MLEILGHHPEVRRCHRGSRLAGQRGSMEGFRDLEVVPRGLRTSGLLCRDYLPGFVFGRGRQAATLSGQDDHRALGMQPAVPRPSSCAVFGGGRTPCQQQQILVCVISSEPPLFARTLRHKLLKI